MNYYTHAGIFHADEVAGFVACRLAAICFGIVRLADISNIPIDGVVSDIGREWDPERLRFDHHQGYFTRENGIPYASFGMIWKTFGHKATENCLAGSYVSRDYLDREFIASVAERVDTVFVQGIDAHDASNSYKLSASVGDVPVRVMSLSNVVAAMNSNDPNDHGGQFGAFHDAAALIEKQLISSIEQAVKFIEAKEKIAKWVDDSPVAIFPEYLPWKEIVCEEYPHIRYVIGPSGHPGNPFSMIAVPVEPQSRELKLPIERLGDFGGFIHQGKWIAGGNSLQELKSLAKLNLAHERKTKD